MRTLKFRAWNNIDKQMIFLGGEDRNSGLNKSPIFQAERGVWEFYANRSFKINYAWEIMQFTGLKDKNGKDAYFSDICRYKDDSGKTKIGVIKDRGYFSAYIEAIGGDEEGNQDGEIHPDYPFEIIGNIYETPTLLKSEE